jgi:hypothetical protein
LQSGRPIAAALEGDEITDHLVGHAPNEFMRPGGTPGSRNVANHILRSLSST